MENNNDKSLVGNRAKDNLDIRKNDNKDSSFTPKSLNEGSTNDGLKKPRNKIALLVVGAVILVILVVCLGYYIGVKAPYDNVLAEYQDTIVLYNNEISSYNTAVDAYNESLKAIDEANVKLEDEINVSEEIVRGDAVAYNPDTLTLLSQTVEAAKTSFAEVPSEKSHIQVYAPEEGFDELPKDTLEQKIAEVEGNIAKTQDLTQKLNEEKLKLVVPDYTDIIEQLSEQRGAAEESIAIQEQITNPTEEWVIDRLLNIGDPITEIAAVTEENDPNGNLNKQGGYTASVYFYTSDLTEVQTGDIIKDGTDAGGCIEVYETVEYAERRDSYLGRFDGTVSSSGSHIVIGTIVIRTSDNLTATKQKLLEEQIIAEFTKME